MNTVNLSLEWGGAVLGLAGAALLASQGRAARYGWVFFLAANMVYIAWALRIGAGGLLVQQSGFIVTSIIGLYKSGIFPKFACRQEAASTKASPSQSGRPEV